MPCSNVAEPEGILSCNRILPGVSPQELDRPSLPRSIPSSPVVESETLSEKQGDATGPSPLDGNQDSSQGEISNLCLANNHEQSQESDTSKAGPYPPGQLNTRSIRGCSPSLGQVDSNNSKRHPSTTIPVAVPALSSTRMMVTRSATKAMTHKRRFQHDQLGPTPPLTRTMVTRSATKAMTRKRRFQHDQVGDSGHCTGTSSIDPTDRVGEKQPRQRKKPKYAAGAVSASGRNPVLSDVSPENQNIPGRAILTVQTGGLKPAYFLTFTPDLVPESSPPGPNCRPADRDQSMLAGSSATISGKSRLYTSDENACLVRLKEREGLSWAEIAEYFPGRSSLSLQVHYSTKLRQKATARSRKRQRC